MMQGTEKPRSLSTLMCPLMQKQQKTVCHKCKFWEHVRGRNPNTGEEMDRWDCVLSFQFTMQMENNKFTYELGAAIESQRNELVELQRLSLRMTHRHDPDALATLDRTFALIDTKNAARLALSKPPLKPTDTPRLPQREQPLKPDL